MEERTRRANTNPNASRRRPNPNVGQPRTGRNVNQRRPVQGRPPANGNRRRKNSKRRRTQNLILRAFVIIILIVGVLGVSLYWTKYGPSKEKADLNEYYGIENDQQMAAVVDNNIVGAGGMIIDGRPYLEYSVVRDHINQRFYWDANENVLLYTLPNDVIRVMVGEKEYTVSKAKQSVDYTILKTEGSTAYIALDFIQEYTNIDYKVYKNPNRVMIVSEWGETKVATAKKSTQVRRLAGVKAPILTEIEKKDIVTVIENEGDWKKVRTKDGAIGYVKKNTLKNERTETISREFEEQEFTSISKDYTINLGFHQVTSDVANSYVLETIASTKGLTTISPTWFSVANTQGDLSSIASADYVNYAHQSGLEVWALVRDFDPLGGSGIGSFEETYELLRYTSRRENLENQLIAATIQSGADGINVDFEMVQNEECGIHFIQFIRELSVKCRQNGLVLSVDNYAALNDHYNRKEQGVFADYIMIMGYDEHWAGSPKAGSVASIDYVREGIEKTLKDVPAEKVINILPFYTRLWTEVPKTEAELEAQAGTDAAEYSTNVTSQDMTMGKAAEALAEAGVTATWDDAAKQNYAQWDVDGATYKIWMEDNQSLEEKLKLMKEYKLAGTAGWKLGQETAGTWELILKYVN